MSEGFSGEMAKERPNTTRTIKDIRSFFLFFIGGNTAWIMFLSVYASSASDKKQWYEFIRLCGTCGLLSAASLIVGALLGFLFGIPRSLASSSAAIAQNNESNAKSLVQPNTNLEQISDWLTKILIGVGLTQISDIKSFFRELSASLAPSLDPLPGPGVIGVIIALAFSFSGFFWSYFESRTSLMRVFSEDVNRQRRD